MGQQKFSLYPYQTSYNNWIQVWEAGNLSGSGVPSTDPGYLGIIPPNYINNSGLGVSVSSLLGWPTYLPFNQSRTIYLSTTDDNWSEKGSLFFTYQNYWGFYITEQWGPGVGGWSYNGQLLGTALAQIGVPTDTNFASCPKFFYPNRLIDLTIAYNGTLPTAPLYVDLGNKGMAEFQIQDSVRYGNSNFALEILTDNPGTTPNFTTQYTVLGSNYPRFVFNNNQKCDPMGSLVVDNFFLPYASVDDPFENNNPPATTITSSIYWLCTEDFVIDGPLNANSFTNLPFDGGLLNVLIDIGNQRRNTGYTEEDPGPDNNATLLLSLIQNGITN